MTRGPARARAPRARLRPAPHRSRERGASPLLRFTRHGIPALAILAGIVMMAFATPSSLVGGAALIGAGLGIWLSSWLYRVGVEGDRVRAQEERARRIFDRTGRWPDA